MSSPYQRRRNLVTRADGKQVNVARSRGQLFVCSGNCCCGRTEDGIPPVPVETYHGEWERRRLRNIVHLTIGGCLGPCALANVAMLLFDGQTLWFQGMNSPEDVSLLWDWVEAMLAADQVLPLPEALAAKQFTATAWQPRPDGQPVDDFRPRHLPREDQRPFQTIPAEPQVDACAVPDDAAVARRIADMAGDEAAPRKNGELVFNAPWEGRAFGMAVALSETGGVEWEAFRRRLIKVIGTADAAGDPSPYYERWVAALETTLVEGGLVNRAEIDERTYQFEFGEREAEW